MEYQHFFNCFTIVLIVAFVIILSMYNTTPSDNFDMIKNSGVICATPVSINTQSNFFLKALIICSKAFVPYSS